MAVVVKAQVTNLRQQGKSIRASGYTKLLCNIKPDGTKTWQKLNSLATGPYKPNIEI